MIKLSPHSAEIEAQQIEALVVKAIEGDRSARDDLARRCLPRVRRTVILSFGYSPDVDDLVQTAMTRIFANLESYQNMSRFWGWVDRITINVIRDHFRQKRWTVFTSFNEEDARHQAPRDSWPDRESDQQRILTQLAGHFERIKPRFRLPLVLFVLQGYTVPEIATMLDENIHTTKKRVLRGRRKLIKQLRHDPVCREAMRELCP